jgi:hypothetical protein
VAPVARGMALPFDLDEVVGNFHYERYRKSAPEGVVGRVTNSDAARKAYYAARPLLPVAVRKHFQRVRLHGWQTIPFPSWPVDVSVETLMQGVMAQALRGLEIDQMPFIWFWPDGAECALTMTHDVEGSAGRDFTPQLMDIDDAFGIKSAFQIVPESPWSSGLHESLRRRGFEVNIHDLNHDGSLFRTREGFERRAARINEHARDLGSSGFRSGAMYREASWFQAFEVEYDMSVPNVAHLEPQRGGCCTVMPHFLGKILELPLTTTQDYSLFHILADYSTRLWEEQIGIIRRHHGLVSFIVHPDYLVERRARESYIQLLTHVRDLRAEHAVWVALPGELNRWWRNRDRMRLVEGNREWTIEGPDSDRARVAVATMSRTGGVTYSLLPTERQ